MLRSWPNWNHRTLVSRSSWHVIATFHSLSITCISSRARPATWLAQQPANTAAVILASFVASLSAWALRLPRGTILSLMLSGRLGPHRLPALTVYVNHTLEN